MRFKLILGVVLSMSAVAFGQVTRLDNETSFSASAMRLDFGNNQMVVAQDGAEAGEVFSVWGINFVGSSSSALTFSPVVRRKDLTEGQIPIGTGSYYVDSVINRSREGTGSSAGRPLTVDFKIPVRRVGFWLAGVYAGSVNLKAFDVFGNFLGAVDQPAFNPDLDRRTFAGVETTAPQGISKVLIDYGTKDTPEEIERLVVDYVSPSTFTTYLPHIADGPQPEGLRLRSTIIVENLTNAAGAVRLRFLDSLGNPLTLRTDGGSVSVLDLQLGPWGSRRISTSGDSDPLRVGYVKIQSTVPVEGSAIYQVFDLSGRLVTEAGVGSAPARESSVAAAERLLTGNFDSGVAVVNVSQVRTTVGVRIFSEDGIYSGLKIFDLLPGEHRARFFTELFPQFASRDVKMTLTVTSKQPLSVVVLRLNQGLPFSSLPVGSTQLPVTLRPD